MDSMDISYIPNTVNDTYRNKPSMDISFVTNTVRDAYRNLQWTSLI